MLLVQNQYSPGSAWTRDEAISSQRWATKLGLSRNLPVLS
jgi:hypothetical protein